MAGAGYGIAALMGLLGGGGKGLYEGYGAGTTDVLNEAKLAELKRQHDMAQEAQFTPVSELPTRLAQLAQPGTAKVRNTILPVYERAQEKQFGEEQAMKFQEEASKISQDPNLSAEQRMIRYLGANPTAPQASILKELAQASNPKMTTTFRDVFNPESNQNEVAGFSHDQHGNIQLPQMTGVRSAGSKSSLLEAARNFEANPTPENKRLLDTLSGSVVLPPGGRAVGRADMAGYSGPNMGQQPSLPGGIPIRAEAPPGPNEATHYIHIGTLQPPPPGMPLSTIQGSGQYIQVPTQSIGVAKTASMVAKMLQDMEDIQAKRPDLFPPPTGNTMQDFKNIAAAKAKFAAAERTQMDPDVQRLKTISVTLPTIARAFGDTGNIAVAERQITEKGVGLSPGLANVNQAGINQLRELYNASITPVGLPPIKGRMANPVTQQAPMMTNEEPWQEVNGVRIRRKR